MCQSWPGRWGLGGRGCLPQAKTSPFKPLKLTVDSVSIDPVLVSVAPKLMEVAIWMRKKEEEEKKR